MNAYIRFQTQLRCGYTGRPAGIFISAGRVRDRRRLPETTLALIRRSLDWFNENLRVPSLDDGDWRCLFWFRPESQAVIRRLWELAYLLEDEGVYVRKVRTDDPGKIVYRDEHQVAAVPDRRSIALRV